MSVDYCAYTVFGARYSKDELETEQPVVPTKGCCIAAEKVASNSFCPKCGGALHNVRYESLVEDGEIQGLPLDVVCGTDDEWIYIGLALGRVRPYDDEGAVCYSKCLDYDGEHERIMALLEARGLADDSWSLDRFGFWTILVCSY